MRVKAILLLAIFLSFAVFANEEPLLKPKPKPQLMLNGVAYIQEEPPADAYQLTNHVLFIFDCSGSMSPGKIQEALDFLIAITTQPTDDMEFAVLAFDAPEKENGFKINGTYRWPGIPEPEASSPIPPGWAGLPSAIAVQRVIQWIIDTKNANGGGTEVVPAIRQALAETRKKLSIVLVSDGIFYDGDKQIMATLKEMVKVRVDNKLDVTSIMVYGVGKREEILSKIATKGGGGYYRKAPLPKKKVENEN